MANILIGSLPGVWIGTALHRPRPADALRPALGCVLLGSALGVLTKAGVDVPAVGDRRRRRSHRSALAALRIAPTARGAARRTAAATTA